METNHQEPIRPRRTGTARSKREVADPRVSLVIRIVFFLMFSGLAVLLAFNGRKAIRDRYFDNRWTTTTTTGVNLQYSSQVEHGEEIFEGAAATRFGVGLLAAAATLAGWAIGLVRLILRGTRPPGKPNWSRLNTVATYASLLSVLVAMVCLLPPEHFRSRIFTTSFYGTIVMLSIAVLAATAARRPKVAALIFPAVAIAAVSIAPLAGGIIFGFFAWLTLGTHVLLLVPALREQALNADQAP